MRGTEIILREIWQDAELTYASLRPEDDKARLRDVRIQIARRRFYPRYSLRNVGRKIATVIGLPWIPTKEKYDYLDEADVILSIGGDRYAMLPNGGYPRDLLDFGEMAMRQNKKFIIWGASIGPFDRSESVKKLFQKHPAKVHLITSRETASTTYLQSLGLNKNVIPCADPAFAISPEIFQPGFPESHLRIGINLSPLSVRHVFGKIDFNKAVIEHAATVAALVRKLGARIILIPHVICSFNQNDDDLIYLQAIKEIVPKELTGHVKILTSDTGFLGVKSEIMKCHLVLAARMHCAINALAAGVPTILISYSQKAKEMAEYVYGNTQWLIHLREFGSQKALKIVSDLISENKPVRSHLKNRLPEIQKDVRSAAVALAEIINTSP